MSLFDRLMGKKQNPDKGKFIIDLEEPSVIEARREQEMRDRAIDFLATMEIWRSVSDYVATRDFNTNAVAMLAYYGLRAQTLPLANEDDWLSYEAQVKKFANPSEDEIWKKIVEKFLQLHELAINDPQADAPGLLDLAKQVYAHYRMPMMASGINIASLRKEIVIVLLEKAGVQIPPYLTKTPQRQ